MPDCLARERITVLQAGLDDAGSNKQVLAAKFRVTHALGVFLERTRLQFLPLLQ